MTVDKRAALNAKKIRNRMAALAAKTCARGVRQVFYWEQTDG
jgi:hypothetical protein